MSSHHLEALKSLGLLDTDPEAIFDRLTTIVVKALRVPVSTLTLIDEHRQFFKSACGLPPELDAARETPLTHSFCKHVVYEDAPLIVEDARLDSTVRDNPAIQSLGVLAYAGMPVRDENGVTIGSLCAISNEARSWSPDELQTLELLADQASAEIALRAKAFHLGLDLMEMQAAEERRHQMVRLDRHDLRTPLNAMLLSVTAIPYSGPVTEAQLECIASVKRNCDAVLSILDRMLDIGNIDHLGAGALNKAAVRPVDLITPALDQVAALAGERQIQPDLNGAVALPPIHADADKVIRVLVNLLANAIKFSGDDAHITLSARARDNDGHPCVIFSVKDNGIGIAPEDQARIFHEGIRLDRTSPTRKSTGLGLTFCKRVVEAHQGNVWVDSVPGQGSTFSFSLPVAERG